MSRSIVNRSSLALRMREKSAAAIPVPLRNAHCRPAPVERLDDFRGQDGLQLLGIGVCMAEVAEDVSVAAHDFEFVGHFNISFNRFNRWRIRSISCCGVLMPFVDFFWKAWTTHRSSPICTA